MSARDELYDAAVDDDICDCYPGGSDEVNARIDAYRDEVLREAADAIEARALDEGTGLWVPDELRAMAEAKHDA